MATDKVKEGIRDMKFSAEQQKENENQNKWNRIKETVGKRLQRTVTPKRLAIALTILYVLSLIPLLWIAWYNYPSADDYSIGSSCRQTWAASHNIFAVLWQGILNAAKDWLHWMGYFTSNFLMAVPPSTFGERWYVLTTWIMLGMLSFSTMYLFHGIFVKAFGADKYISHSISMLVLFASIQCMCPVGRVEAFYWYSGAANYIFVHSMSLFFFGLLVSSAYDTDRKRIWDLTAASVLGFFTGGGNQMTALNVAVVLLAVTVVMVYRKESRRNPVWIPIIVFYLGFLLNVAAPGNWVRAEDASGMNPVKAVLVSFYECLDRAVSQWTTWPVVLIMVLLVPLFWHMAEKITFRFPYPLVAVGFGFCLVSAMATPPLFAVGNMEAGRIQALIYLMYVLILALCVGYVTGWARKLSEGRRKTEREEKAFSVESSWCILGCLLFLIFGSALMVVPEPHYFTFSSALEDLTNGSAQAYGEALQNRMELYRSGAEGVIEVEPLPAQPILLYFSDIKEDSEDWENRGLSRFYGIDGAAVRRD